MDFKITDRQKYLFIISSALLILCSIAEGLQQYVTDNVTFNWTPIKDIIYAASKGYVLYILIAYFRFYALQTLSVLTKILLMAELISSFILILNSFSNIDLSALTTPINILRVILEIIWLFYLIPLKGKDYSAILSLYKYGIAIIVTFFIALAVVFNLMYSEKYSLFGIQDFILAIPYLFLIDFGLKIKHDKDTVADT